LTGDVYNIFHECGLGLTTKFPLFHLQEIYS